VHTATAEPNYENYSTVAQTKATNMPNATSMKT
jgi:hypothetical protein